MAIVRVRTPKDEQRYIAERGRLLDDPLFATDRDAIAGGKSHACMEATRIPWKNYRIVCLFCRFRISGLR